MPYSDAKELLSACVRSRSNADWREFRRRFEPKLRSGIIAAFCRQGGRPGRETIEDLVQETYCKLLERRGRVLSRCESNDDPAVAAYLGRVAERVALDYLRAEVAEKRGGGRIDSLEVITEREGEGRVLGTPAEAEDRVLTAESRRRFLDNCRRVAGRSRERNLRILWLAFFEGLTSREISHQLGSLISPNGIDTMLHRARKRLASLGFSVPRRQAAGGPPGQL